jgi:cytochrome c oxidase subunit 4
VIVAGSASHPTPRLYWIVAAVLAVVTAAEVAVGTVDSLSAIKVPGLFALGAVKFAAVVAFFMHLKFDKPLYRSLFLVGLFGALPIFIVVLLTFEALTAVP